MAIADILESLGTTQSQNKPSAELIVRRLATNKPLRVFLTDIARMPKPQFKEFASDFKALFSLAQSDIISSTDSGILLEVMKYPQFAALMAKIAEVG